MKVNQNKYFLSALVLCTLAFVFTDTSTAQNEAQGKPLSLSIGTVRTHLEKAAIRHAVTYAEDLSGRDFQTDFKKSLVYFTPDLSVETGEEDAFNSLVVKVTGNVLFFGTTEIDGITTPNTSFFHAVPISIGMETDRGFSNVAALAEFGYVPWFQGKAPRPLKKTYIGAFLQGGYKAKIDKVEPSLPEGGGDIDESAEKPDSALFRLRATAKYGLEKVINTKTGFGLGIFGSADVWYDVVNTEVYYKLGGTFRIILSNEHYFDFLYEKGSGAPNFNEGDQFSASLTIKF